MNLKPLEAYRLWAASYDATPNPLLALEERLLKDRLGSIRGLSILDVGCGTGRWMSRLATQGAQVFGIDLCDSMLAQAAAKPGLAGRCAVAGIERIPVENLSFDLALCSFTLSYTADLSTALSELARVAWTVIISDLHPETGWSRSFRAQSAVWEIDHSRWTEQQIDDAARAAGLTRAWRITSPFEEPERNVFIRAGKETAFAEAASRPAVLITAFERKTWTKSFNLPARA